MNQTPWGSTSELFRIGCVELLDRPLCVHHDVYYVRYRDLEKKMGAGKCELVNMND